MPAFDALLARHLAARSPARACRVCASHDDPWFALTGAAALGVPPIVRPWLTLATSMTDRLRAARGPQLQVMVLRQTLRAPLYGHESRVFGRRRAQGFVREVCLQGGGTPLLVARTVLLSRRLKHDPLLQTLGNTPLGELLFANGRRPRWLLREGAQLTPSSGLFALVRPVSARPARPYWARRTLYVLAEQPLLVTEIFLPTLWQRPPGDSQRA